MAVTPYRCPLNPLPRAWLIAKLGSRSAAFISEIMNCGEGGVERLVDQE